MTHSRTLRAVPAAVIMTTTLSWGMPVLAEEPRRSTDLERPATTAPALPARPAVQAPARAPLLDAAPTAGTATQMPQTNGAAQQPAMPPPSLGHTAAGSPAFSVGEKAPPADGPMKR